MNPRLILAFLYRRGPLDELVEWTRRNPYRAVTCGWLAVLSVALVALLMARADVPVAKHIAGTDEQVVPLSADGDFRARDFCRKATQVTAIEEADIGGVRRIAYFGLDSLNWPDSGGDIATYYYIDANGVQQSRPVTIDDAVDCMRTPKEPR